MEEKKRGSFTGTIGFVLAAAGSAVGLGNLWRFPYLAAKDGGGLFLVVYIILALTFGFALMTTEIAIGRKTGRSPIAAFGLLSKKFTWLGWVAILVPLLIFPYYSVIGGWVCRYAFGYLTGQGASIGGDINGYFTGTIGATGAAWVPILWMIIFMAATAVFVFLGVDKGIEKCSKLLMPLLLLLIVGIAVYSITLSDPVSGRTALQGLKIYALPNFEGVTFAKLMQVILDAMGQMFFSMSLAMGIMITYGSYMPKSTNMVSSVNQIEWFDTGIALLAGLIMVPVVYCFQGMDGLNAAGPSLMFKSLPQIFSAMGTVGNVIGALFFLLVIFAALTSSISILEAIVAMVMDHFHVKRSVACSVVLAITLAVGLVTCFGYNIWYFEASFATVNQGQILDILDWFSNNLLMPVVAIATCVVVGWFSGTQTIVDEVKLGDRKFRREKLYVVMTKFVAPLLLLFILLNSFNVFHF